MVEQVSENSIPRVVGSLEGSVKWFDNKLGYGYITIVTPNVSQSNGDYFVHQTNIHPLVSQYRTLSKGEYVSLNLSDDKVDERPQALDVAGICGGALRCDLPRPPRRIPGEGGGEGGGGRGGRGGGGRGRGGGRGGGHGGGHGEATQSEAGST